MNARVFPQGMFLCLVLSMAVGCAMRGRPHVTIRADYMRFLQGPRVPDVVLFPTTTFVMGSPVENVRAEEYRGVEKPRRPMTVSAFAMGRFLVTAEEFCQFLNEAGNAGYFNEKPLWIDWRTIRKLGDRYVPQVGAERCPAYPVTWIGAVAYCDWLSAKLGVPLRLPSEAEWELAARGPELRDWPWGSETPVEIHTRRPLFPEKRIHYLDDPPETFVPFRDLRGPRWGYYGYDRQRYWEALPVGSFPANATPQGIYDMLGYTSGQWCGDEYLDKVDREREVPEERNDAGVYHVVRGMQYVPIDYDTCRPSFFVLRLLIPDDAKFPQYTEGRSWSRIAGHSTTYGAMFRVAVSIPCSGAEESGGANPQR